MPGLLLALVLTVLPMEGLQVSEDEGWGEARSAVTDSVSLRVVTYNIAGGRYGDLDTLAAVMASLKPDVVALQEVASNWDAASMGTDQAAALGQKLGMTSFFAPIYSATDAEGNVRQFGLAVLTPHPIVRQTNHALTRLSTQQENAVPRPMPGFPEVVVRIGGADVRVFNTHLDYRRDPAVRHQQVREMLDILGELGLPTLLVGDLNAPPAAPELAPLLARLQDAWAELSPPGFTIPVHAPERRIDYVLVSAKCTVRQAFVPEAQASDHRAVVADLTCAP